MSRRKGRRERRQADREQHKIDRSEAIGGLEGAFTFHKAYKRGKACCQGSNWKGSTQRHKLHLFSGTAKRRKLVISRRYRWRSYTRFHVNERGKDRTIDAPHINDRQVQKVIVKEVLTPLYLPDMIHNNGASLPGKGLAFSRRELKRDLLHHLNKYGMNGYIILADCKGFFPTAPHWSIRERHRRLIRDDGLRELADSILDTIHEGVGVPLGVEPSQMEMVALPSPLDNFVKCQLGLEGAGHYMDDYILLVPPDAEPTEILRRFTAKAAEIGLTISERKTRIIRFGKPFRFCKAKYSFTESGGLRVNGCRDSARRARHKIKAFHGLVETGDMSYTDLWASVQGAFNYFEEFDDHGRVLRLRRVFYAVYGFSGEHYETFLQKELEKCSTSRTEDSGPRPTAAP